MKTVKYRNTTNKNGEYAPHLPEDVTKKLNAFCKKLNLNRQDYVAKAVMNQLNHDLKAYMEGLEELIENVRYSDGN